MTDGVYDRYVREQQRLLAEENLKLRRERDQLEADLGETRRRLDNLRRQVHELANERDQFAAGLPLVCSDERHAAKVHGLETRLAEAEARLAELENEDEGDWMSGMLWARKLSILNVPLVSPAFTGDTTDPWETAAEAARQHELVAARLADYLADHAVPGLNGVPHRGDAPAAPAEQQIVILPPQPVRPGPMLFQPCAAPEPAPGLTFDGMATLINEYRMPEPRRAEERSAPSPTSGLTVVTTDPVQEIAAEPATVDRLKSQFLAKPTSRLGAQLGQIGEFFGFPIVIDMDLPPGEVHMRPHRHGAEDQS